MKNIFLVLFIFVLCISCKQEHKFEKVSGIAISCEGFSEQLWKHIIAGIVIRAINTANGFKRLIIWFRLFPIKLQLFLKIRFAFFDLGHRLYKLYCQLDGDSWRFICNGWGRFYHSNPSLDIWQLKKAFPRYAQVVFIDSLLKEKLPSFLNKKALH